MTEKLNNTEGDRRGLVPWLLFPLALFPLAALLTYDWRAMPALNLPAAPSTNWVGALGDNFAYYGYLLFGLAIWIIPIVCIVCGVCMITGRRMRHLRRISWFVAFMISSACLMQVIGSHGGVLNALAQKVNISAPGGAVGYMTMTRFLSPLISDFSSSVVMAIVMTISLVAAIGVHNLAGAIQAVLGWALAHDSRTPPPPTGDEETDRRQMEQFRAALEAKEAAKRQREEEKAAAKAEKLRLAEERRLQKEAERAAKFAARQQPDPAMPARPAVAADNDAKPDLGPYSLPPLSLLNPQQKSTADHGDVTEMSKRLIDTLKIFGVDATLSYTVEGPVVTKYAVELTPGTRYSTVTNISDELMGALRAKSLRIEAPIPGEDRVGIEVPNPRPAGISFREIFESKAWKNFKGELPLLFGKDAAGRELVADLAKMPHMLVAGATGQGKSVCLNSIINGMLMTKTPEQLKLIMVDPKSVEFTSYSAIPHLLVPVITDNKKVVFSLHWAVAEMEKRLKLFARARVRNIYDYNHRPTFTQTDMFGNDTSVGSDMPKTVPYIVIIIDEVADLMSQCSKEVTPDISRLTAKARAAGIHLILATQRPDAKIITGTIKANIPGRVAFKTATAIDSRTILDDCGAENLIGKGDMLFKTADGLLIRAQGAWISDEEIARITNYIEQHSNVQFDEKFAKNLNRVKEAGVADPFAELDGDQRPDDAEAAAAKEQVKADENASDFKKAVECIINTNRASTSHFQRRLGWGYNHSAKIMDMLEDAGVIGPQSGAGPRQIIMDQQQLLAIFNGSSATEGNSPDAEDAVEGNLFEQEDNQ